jgi:hypothetical protein
MAEKSNSEKTSPAFSVTDLVTSPEIVIVVVS